MSENNLNYRNWDNYQVHFLEVPGKPGRIYLEDVVFGAASSFGVGFNLNVDGHVSTPEFLRSPVLLFPEANALSSPLHRILDQYRSNLSSSQYSKVPVSSTVLPECTIWVENKIDGKVTARPKYQLFQVKVIKVYATKNARNYNYELDFAHYNLVKKQR